MSARANKVAIFCALALGACARPRPANVSVAPPVLTAPRPGPGPAPVPEPAPVAEPAPVPEPEPEPGLDAIVVHKGTRVLMFGDSMVTSGLGVSLQERVEALGGKWFHISKPSSTSATWSADGGKKVDELIARARPDIVIVVLASNELFVPNPGARAGDVRAIVKRVGSRPCVWVGPSPWRPEKGMIGVVRANAAPCRFFDSSSLRMERGPDGIHPSLAGGRLWADAVWDGVFRAE